MIWVDRELTYPEMRANECK